MTVGIFNFKQTRSTMKQMKRILFVCLTVCGLLATAQEVTEKSSEFFAFDEEQVNGTTGTPLGGFGCGGVKFNANEGTFAVMPTPPADAYDFKLLKGTHLELTVGNTHNPKLKAAMKTDGRPDDDAIWPLHRVNFGQIGGVEASMTGISPLDNQEYENMHLPYALFEVVLKNNNVQTTDAVFSFVWVKNDAEWAIVAAGEETNVVTETDGDMQKIKVSVSLKPSEVKRINYVLAWYDRTDPELGYYMNLYEQPREIALHGLKVFDRLKANAERLVNGMRGSSLPHWFQNQVLNTLSSTVLNAMYKRDGRVAFAEGQWTCFGTMDQMWLARQIFCQLMPFYAWQELNYWARTQMKNGQIHHDFNKMDVGSDRAKRSVLCPWDDTEHQDYRNIQKWVDLNAGFIISVYEAYRLTDNEEEFHKLWPYMKKAGQRIFKQVEELGNKQWPFTFNESENSYDAGGNPDPYNANLSALAYRMMAELAEKLGEKEIAKEYLNAYNQVRRSYSERYINGADNMMGKHCENIFTGQQMAMHLKMGEIWNQAETDTILKKLENYYYPYYWGLGYPAGTYDEWTPYLLVHYGGLLLNTGRLDQWYVLQKDAYMRQYQDRERVFDHALNILPAITEPKWISKNIRSKKQYISLPSAWRTYYDVIGFHRDARTDEIWLKPILHKSMQGQLKAGYFLTPETDGFIDYEETATKKNISVRTTAPLHVKSLRLIDDFKGKVKVNVNGKRQNVKRTGSGYTKELVVFWEGDVTSEGVRIDVVGKRIVPELEAPAKPDRDFQTAFKLNDMSPFEGLKAAKADKSGGTKKEKAADGLEYITSCNNFDYLQFSNVDFAREGTKTIVVRVRTQFADSELEVMLDDTAGTLVGSYKLPSTNGEWQELEFPISKITKLHNVILRFFGTRSDNLMDIDWIKFKNQ